MSSHVAGLAITGINSKWELAQRLTSQATAPKDILRSIFEGAMQHIQEIAKTKFESPMKERVWEAVSGQRLLDIRNTLIQEYCTHILDGFTEDEAAEMLEEHQRTGAVTNELNCARIQTADFFFHSSIMGTIVAMGESMKTEFIPEIVAAVRSEGISLPIPARK